MTENSRKKVFPTRRDIFKLRSKPFVDVVCVNRDDEQKEEKPTWRLTVCRNDVDLIG